MKPNIFDYAANGLSQDAFVAWLLNYADPSRRDNTYTFDDQGLFVCGTKLIREMLFTHDIPLDSKIAAVNSGCQRDGIDIWAEITLQNNRKYLVLIEHEHNGITSPSELTRHKRIAGDYCRKNGFEAPLYIFLKAGDETPESLDRAKKLGFSLMHWKSIVLLMAEFSQIRNDIFSDFYEHIRNYEARILRLDEELVAAE